MWFKNILVYQFDCDTPLQQWSAGLTEKALKPCPPHARFSQGWTHAFSDEFIHEVAGYAMTCMTKEERLLPRGVIHRVLMEKIEQLETQQARQLKRSEKKQLAEDLEFDLLPKSFCLEKKLFALFDTHRKRLIIDTSSATQAHHLIALLKNSVLGFSFEPMPYPEQLASLFADWVLHPKRLPTSMQLGSECILFDLNNEKKRVQCKGYELPADEVLTLLHQGMAIAELSLIWNERIQFNLTHDFVFKKIKCMDYLVDEFHDIQKLDEDYQQADASLTLLGGELQKLLNDFEKIFNIQPVSVIKEHPEEVMA